MVEPSSLQHVDVTVDGRPLQAYAGLTVLEALLLEGVHVPNLCYDLRLTRSNGNCGLCVVTLTEADGTARDVKACITPVRAGMTITTTSEQLNSYRKVRIEQLLADHNADCVAPCVSTCPAHIDIQLYLMQVRDHNDEAALRVIKDRNPFPSVCGRVCPHPCEAQCRRGLVDEPVAINHVKRYVADKDLFSEQPWLTRVAAPTGKRVAVVGAGPSGLSAAYYCAIDGHAVTVFERQPKPGGMMRYGIPEYRLPKETLDQEIDVIKRLGVEVVTGKALGTHLRLEDLQDDFDAVYLAIGSWTPTPLHLDGENLPGVQLGITYLEQVTKGTDAPAGEEVVVIGGGNTAIDCARTALRRGAQSVRVVYRRTQAEMPAEPLEVAEAMREGVEFVFLAAPTRIDSAGEDSAADRKTVQCLRMSLGEPDRSGRRRPVPIDGSEFELVADTVIGAIGQSTNTQFLYHDAPVRLSKWGDVEIDGHTMRTSESKVFAGGDCVTGPATVIQAVAAGRRAAKAIHEFLERGYVKPSHENYACSRGSLEDLPRWEYEELPKLARAPMPQIPDTARTTTFTEVELGLSEEAARAEASRCLRCGCVARYDCRLRSQAREHGVAYTSPLHERPYVPIAVDHPFIKRDHNKCISCGRCIAACAEVEGPGVLAYQFSGGTLRVGTHDGRPLIDTDCVSCGQCVSACPCGALDYRRDRGKIFRAFHNPDVTVVGFIAPAVRSLISTEYGIPPEQASGYVAAVMRRLGFDKVFDFTFAADLTIVEETSEFLRRVEAGGPLPHLTSCCPGWVNFVERRYPGLIPHLSSCRSPQQMMGATVKNHFARWAGIDPANLYVVSVVPCLAKKYEAARPEFATDGRPDVDAILTTTELIEMVKEVRLDLTELAPEPFDEPYAHVTGAGVLFGASGGVAEATLRMAVEKLAGKPLEDLDVERVRGFKHLKETTVTAGGRRIRVAVVSGLANVEPLAKRLLAGEDLGYDLIEVMACPGGCIDGAGHPVPSRLGEMEARQKVLVDIDQHSTFRTSQSNPDILRLYDEFYGEPGSELAHRLLHTSYAPYRAGA